VIKWLSSHLQNSRVMWGRAVHGVDRLDRGASAWFSCVEPIGSVTGVRNRRPVQGWLAEPIASVGARGLCPARVVGLVGGLTHCFGLLTDLGDEPNGSVIKNSFNLLHPFPHYCRSDFELKKVLQPLSERQQ
jgi:hypothetical protein